MALKVKNSNNQKGCTLVNVKITQWNEPLKSFILYLYSFNSNIMTTKISTLFSCRASGFPDLSSDDSRMKIYAGNVDWRPFLKMKETPRQRCLQSTSTSTFKWKDPQIQSYLINTPFSFLAFTFLLFWHYFINIESPSVMSSTLIPSSFRVIWEVLHFFFKIRVIGGSIGCEFSWFSGST